MEVLKAYELYIAIKLHFTTDYDFFRYGGKTNVAETSFLSRSDRYSFYKLAKKTDLQGFLVANIVNDPAHFYARNLATDSSCEDVYKAWSKRQQSLTYVVEQDIKKLSSDFKENFIVPDNSYPLIVNLVMKKDITFEGFTIICSILDAYKYLEKHIKDTIIYPDINKRSKRYVPFLKFDKKKILKLLLDKFTIKCYNGI